MAKTLGASIFQNEPKAHAHICEGESPPNEEGEASEEEKEEVKELTPRLAQLENWFRERLTSKWAEEPRKDGDVLRMTHIEAVATMKIVNGEVVFTFIPR